MRAPRHGFGGVAALAAVLALAALAAGCGERPAGAGPAPDRRELVVLVHPVEPPCAYRDASGELAGWDVELARRIAARLGRELAVREAPFAEIIPRVKSGEADFGIASIAITEARARDVAFSRPYRLEGNRFIYRAGEPPPRASALHALRVAVERDTTGDLYLCTLGYDPVRFDNCAQAIEALERKRIDAFFFDSIPLASIAAASGGRLAVSALVTPERYAVAVNRSRADVLEAANACVEGYGR